MIDYKLIMSSIIKIIKADTGKPVVPQNNTNDMPAYPFCTYTITSPYLSVSSSYEDETLNETVEMVISLTWCAKDLFEAATYTQRTAAGLKHQKNRQILTENGITIVKCLNFGNRDTFLSIDTEFRNGFDLRIRVSSSDTREMDFIRDVNITTKLVR